MSSFSFPEHLLDLQPRPGSVVELERFGRLQSELESRFRRFSDPQSELYTVVVVPSQSIPAEELAALDGAEHSEERLLHHLMLLRQPNVRVVLVTSKAIEACIVDYYLASLPDVPLEAARRRLLLLDSGDAATRPLTEKILERPALVRRIKDAIADPRAAHLEHYNTSGLERTLAVQLGIPMNATDPALLHRGTKSGSREAFARAGVATAEGRENLRDARDIAQAVVEIWEARPQTRRMIVKQNSRYSGEGNAVLDLASVASLRPGEASTRRRVAAIEAALPNMQFGLGGLTWEQYEAQFEANGGVCEEWIDGAGMRSPSVQVGIDPSGQARAVSTHDQVLAGPAGQNFQGATFPAHESYRLAIQTLAETIGGVLASDGVIGCFGVDFLVRPQSAKAPEVFAVEINLRHGGTTHCFNMLKFISDGRYDRDTGCFFNRHGDQRVYYSVDVLRHPAYRGISPLDLITCQKDHGLHVSSEQTGVVFHRLGSLQGHGKLGFTAFAGSAKEAEAFRRRTLSLLDALA